MCEGITIKSHITEFTFIINELDKIEIKIEDENQIFLLLCSLSFSYKSFREAIIYGGNSTIKVNKVKEHLLNKDKIDKQLTRESHCDDSEQVFFLQRRSVVMEVLRVTQNTKIWYQLVSQEGTY